MASLGNGHGDGHPRITRRWDLDDLKRRPAVDDEASASGRRFVVAGIVATLLIWGAVYLAFLYWRATYRALAEFGANQVAPLVDPMAERVPPGVEPGAWKSAVADTHALLVALTGAGLLDRPTMEALRADVAARVARATPESARAELTRLWDDIEARAGPAVAPDDAPPPPGSRQAARHPRPRRPELLRAAKG